MVGLLFAVISLVDLISAEKYVCKDKVPFSPQRVNSKNPLSYDEKREPVCNVYYLQMKLTLWI